MRILREPTTQAELTDDQLVDRCLAGNHDAFGTLYDRHLSGVYAYAYRLLGNQSDAEDAAHDAFTRAWSKLPQYQGVNFRGWLFSILHNLCMDRVRRQ